MTPPQPSPDLREMEGSLVFIHAARERPLSREAGEGQGGGQQPRQEPNAK